MQPGMDKNAVLAQMLQQQGPPPGGIPMPPGPPAGPGDGKIMPGGVEAGGGPPGAPGGAPQEMAGMPMSPDELNSPQQAVQLLQQLGISESAFPMLAKAVMLIGDAAGGGGAPQPPPMQG